MPLPIEPLGAPTDNLPPNLGALVRSAAERHRHTPALQFEGYDDLTFEEVGSLTAGARDALRQMGVRKGDRVLVALDNRPEYQILWLACGEAGAVFVPMNPTYGPADASHVIENSAPRAVIWLPSTHDRHAMLLPAGTSVATVGDPRQGAALFSLNQGDLASLGRGVTHSDYVTLSFTSGTTGLPKGCVSTQEHWLLLAKILARGLELTDDDRLLTAQPCFYGDPQYNLVAALWSGTHLTVLRRFRSQTFWEQVRQSRATKFWCIGTMPAMLMNTPPGATDGDHNLTAVWCVGIPRPLHGALEERFQVRWLEAFGTSETGVNLFQALDSPAAPGEGWLGDPVPYTEVRLVDQEGKVVDGDGEAYLELKTPLLFSGYWDAAQHRVREIPRGSWFRTGDILERRGGKYRFARREKDIVRRSGENISCREVEEILRKHPKIIDVAIVPRPDDIRGEEVWAFVLTEAGAAARDPSPEDIFAHASQRLARHKVPRFLTYVEQFPMTPSERIAKHKLPDIVAEGQTYDRQEGLWM